MQATTAANGQVHNNTLNVHLQDVLAQPLEVTGQTYQGFDLNHDGHLDLLVQQAVMVQMH